MSSRQKEKEQRRRERLAKEEAARRAQARRKRLMIAGAGGAAAVAAAVVIAVASGGGDGGGSGGGASADAAIPARSEQDLAAAARAAGCEVKQHRDEGSSHTEEAVRYGTNPPTSGAHAPSAAADGIYAAGNPPELGQSVHALEHGRVNIQYRPGTPARRVAQLETLFNEEVKGQSGYHTLLFENQTDMQAAVAATAWTQSLTCRTLNDRTWDALRAFREDFVDKGPEFVP